MIYSRFLPRPVSVGAFLSLVLAGAPVLARADDAPAPADPGHGKVIFQTNCVVCHATGQDAQATAGEGPVLGGIVGRPAASIPYFGYTRALRSSGLTRDRATLDRFITNPQALVNGTAMVVMVPAASDRADLISYLATLPKVDAATLAALSASGQNSAGDWMNDAPGKVHAVHIDLLPPPFASRSAQNGPGTVDRPANAALSVPPGFTVRQFAAGLSGPRLIRTAPNGDLFIAETRSGRIRVLRAPDGADAPTVDRMFARGLMVRLESHCSRPEPTQNGSMSAT